MQEVLFVRKKYVFILCSTCGLADNSLQEEFQDQALVLLETENDPIEPVCLFSASNYSLTHVSSRRKRCFRSLSVFQSVCWSFFICASLTYIFFPADKSSFLLEWARENTMVVSGKSVRCLLFGTFDKAFDVYRDNNVTCLYGRTQFEELLKSLHVHTCKFDRFASLLYSLLLVTTLPKGICAKSARENVRLMSTIDHLPKTSKRSMMHSLLSNVHNGWLNKRSALLLPLMNCLLCSTSRRFRRRHHSSSRFSRLLCGACSLAIGCI